MQSGKPEEFLLTIHTIVRLTMSSEPSSHVVDLLRLQNKILVTRIYRLELLKSNYEGPKHLELQCFQEKMNALSSKIQYMAMRALSTRLVNLKAKIDLKLAEEKSRLSAYRNLDPNLMAEYLRLKDDLECQEMLIKMSENNAIYRTP